MGGKGRGEIGGDAGEVTGVVADAPTTDMAWEKGMERLVDGGWQLEKWRYCWWLVLFDVDGGAEVRLVNNGVNIQECDMGRGDGLGKSDRIATIEALKEEEKGIMTMSPQQ